MMSGRPKHPKYARNKNVIVIGGSGSGKTRFYVKPNLMQMPQKVSYVVTDPKGSIVVECGNALLKNGYKLKILNTINFKKSMGHELLSRDELAVLDGGKCILQLRGVRPFLSDKYDLTQHPNYKLTSDYDPKNTFDIEKYLNRKEKINPNDEFVVIDADSLPSA